MGETRVAVTPETVKKLKAQGHTVYVQSGAGVAASVTDAAYVAVGADITDAAGALGCALVLKVRTPSDAKVTLMNHGATLVGMLNPFDAEGLQAIATAKRSGAVIEASDVRPSVKEQVESLGGKCRFPVSLSLLTLNVAPNVPLSVSSC